MSTNFVQRKRMCQDMNELEQNQILNTKSMSPVSVPEANWQEAVVYNYMRNHQLHLLQQQIQHQPQCESDQEQDQECNVNEQPYKCAKIEIADLSTDILASVATANIDWLVGKSTHYELPIPMPKIRSQRRKGQVYLVKGARKKWDGKRFARCCIKFGCTKLSQGSTPFCKGHGFGIASSRKSWKDASLSEDESYNSSSGLTTGEY